MPVLPHGANPDTEAARRDIPGAQCLRSRCAGLLVREPFRVHFPPDRFDRAGVNAAHATDTERVLDDGIPRDLCGGK